MMPRCYMVKKGLQRHEGPSPCSPTEASVAPPYYSPTEHIANTERQTQNGSGAATVCEEAGVECGLGSESPGTGAQYTELSKRATWPREAVSERSAAETEAAHDLLSLAEGVPQLPPTLVTVIEPLPLYTYDVQPTNIYIFAEDLPEPVYTTVQAVAPLPIVKCVEPQLKFVTYQPADNTLKDYAGTQFIEEVSDYIVQEIRYPSVEPELELSPKALPQALLARREKQTKYYCSECGKRYATSSNLSRHKQTHRSLNSQSAKRCGECGKAYVSMPALAMHVLTHRMGHVCGVCGKQFSRPWLLRGHLRSHTGEKPYSCAECLKAFADRSNLRAHLQTHSVDKKYECDRCRKAFALKSYLNKHQEAVCVRADDG